jgi:hypothetical protein
MGGQAAQLQDLMGFFTVEGASSKKVGAGGTAQRSTAVSFGSRPITASAVVREEKKVLDIDVEVINKAIEAHTQWKTKLRQCMSDHNKCADPAVVEKDNLCGLGQWIYSDGRKLNGEPMFDQLRIDHASFHKCAARIIREIQAGRQNEAEKLMGTEYGAVASKVITALSKMKSCCR